MFLRINDKSKEKKNIFLLLLSGKGFRIFVRFFIRIIKQVFILIVI